MLGRTIMFAGGAMVFAIIATPRQSMNAVPSAAPTATPGPKQASFFDPIPVNVVHSGRTRGGATLVSGRGSATEIQRGPGGHFLVHAKINGYSILTIVDTGATTVALSVADARAAAIPVDESRFRVIGTGASGPVRGMPINLREVDVGGHRVTNVRGAVLEGLDGSLLGQSYLRQLESVEIRGDVMHLR